MLDFRHLRHSSRTVARLLPHGEGFAEHCHDRGHLIYAASGVLTIRTRRGTAIVPPNRAAWTPAGVRHQHRAYGRTEMRVLFLPEPPSARLREPVVLATSPLVRELLLAITGDHQYPTPSWERLRDVLLDELTRAPEQDLHLPEPSDTRLRAVTDLLHADPAVPGTLAELGRAVGASERTLSRLCHTELGRVSVRGGPSCAFSTPWYCSPRETACRRPRTRAVGPTPAASSTPSPPYWATPPDATARRRADGSALICCDGYRGR
jgi:mannose-6-phosphate isomerase-like protein (cupin superfamily)